LLRRGGKHSQSLYQVASDAPLDSEDTVPVAGAGERTQQLTTRLYRALLSAADGGVFRGSIAGLGQQCGISAAQTRVAWRRVKQEFPIIVLQEGKRYLPTVVQLDATPGGDKAAAAVSDAPFAPFPSEVLAFGGTDRGVTDAELEALALGRLALERLLEYARAEAAWEAELAEWRGRAERAEAELAHIERLRVTAARSGKGRAGALPLLTPEEREKLVEILGLGESRESAPGAVPRQPSRS
jgi:hypothetical protein